MTEIENVSDTSLWVAHYRAQETERPDALFKDPYAKALCGERGKAIAEQMKTMGRYTAWSVISRTVLIDEFILKLISEGVDTVINLGTGLDSRPYRMKLPANLRWIEVDFPNIIRHKSKILENENPSCRLERYEVNLTSDAARSEFFKTVFGNLAELSNPNPAQASTTHVIPPIPKALVLTEGVIPYLTPEQVSGLSDELFSHPQIHFWIAEYFNPGIYRYLKAGVRTKRMKNAPFQFYPPDWLGFFHERGWVDREIGYASDIAIRFKRTPPTPWIAKLFLPFMSKERKENMRKASGYVIFRRRNA